MSKAVLGWSASQGHILTGGGELVGLTQEGVDYDASDLPHFYLASRSTRKQFSEWLASGARSSLICGCWSRPVFAGGWQRDTDVETEAFNLQTPSLFIDMRFPVGRPTERLRRCESLEGCTTEDLCFLSRQHCFAGYSQPSTGRPGSLDADQPHFTRHHCIDWNYHPSFPRPRPNKWWVLASPDGLHFKEYSFARDARRVPVYYEQWTRRPGDGQGAKYLAARRLTECPLVSAAQGRQPQRDALLVVVGNHFALAVDRPQPLPAFAGLAGPAGPALVDQALGLGAGAAGSGGAARSGGWGGREAAMAACAAYLDLEGSYGFVRSMGPGTGPSAGAGAGAGAGYLGALDSSGVAVSGPGDFVIVKSTHPWREGQRLGLGLEGSCTVDDDETGRPTTLHWAGFAWALHECSFTGPELREMLGCAGTGTGTGTGGVEGQGPSPRSAL